MKTTLKRLIALVLAMSMCLSMLSVNVWAVELELSEDDIMSIQSSEEGVAEEEVSMETDAPVDEEAPAEEPSTAIEEERVQGETPAETEPEEEKESAEAEAEREKSDKTTVNGEPENTESWDQKGLQENDEPERNDCSNSWRFQNGKRIWSSSDSLSTQEMDPSDAKSHGIDVSSHQGDIDWTQVKGQINFAIIRCGYGQDRTSQDDAKFSRNTSECEKYGIPYGVYLYSYATNSDSARSEANHAIRLLKGKNLSLPVFYDLEDQSIRNSCSNAQILEQAKIFCNALQAAGYKVGIYANLDWWRNCLTSGDYNQWERWYAQYNSRATYTGSFNYWQYSDKGSVPGISGNVDMDYSRLQIPADPCTCITSYAGQYTCTSKSTLVIRSGHGTGYGQLGSIPSGATVTVTMGDGSWAHVEYNGIQGYASMQYLQKKEEPVPRGSEMSSGYDRTLPDGDYLIVNAGTTDKSSFYYLDIEGTAQPASSGTNVSLCGPLSGTSGVPSYEIWTLSYSGGFYSIKQKGTNAALDVNGADTACGTNIQVWEGNTSSAQKWAISSNGRNGYRIQAKCSGYSLDVTGGGCSNGTNVQQYANNDTDAQSWLFIPYKPSQPIENGRYILLSAMDESIELDVAGDTGNIAENTNVQIWKDTALSKYNSFDFTKLDNGYYRVIHAASGKALDVSNGVSSYGSNVCVHTNNGSPAQQWAVTKTGNYYYLRARCSGYSLDLDSGGTKNGTNVQQWPYNGNNVQKNQTWKFVKAEYKVDYNANGGSNAPARQTKYYKENLTLNKSEPTRSNYYFKNWNTKADGSGTAYSSGASYSLDADVTLYAQWIQSIPVATMTYNGHTYETYDYHVKWEEAKKICEQKGGHLVSITSEEENKAVLDLVRKGGNGCYYIGCTDKEKDGDWKWVNGEAFSYNNWDKDYPEPSGGADECCAIIIAIDNPPNKQVGEWCDIRGDETNSFYSYTNTGFICEYEPKATDLATCTIKLSETSFIHDGTAKEPAVTVQDGDKTLTKGTDYEVAYKNNINAGTATVTITGKGDYTGSVDKTFTIAEDTMPILDPNEADTVFTVGSMTASQGGEITVPISITKHPGIAGFALDIDYDHDLLTLKNASAASELGGTFTRHENSVTWFTEDNISLTGKAFELTFDVSANAGDVQTDIALSMHEGKPNVTDENSANLTAAFQKGTVTIRSYTPGDVTGDNDVTIADVVKINRHVVGKITLSDAESRAADVTGDKDITIADVVKVNRFVVGKITTLAVSKNLSTQSSSDATITVGSANAKPGEKVSIPVTLSGNPGIAGMALEFTLPDGMTLDSITADEVLKDGTFTQNGNTITWYTTDNIIQNGVILNLNVTAPHISGEYTLRAALKENKARNLSDENSENVGAAFEEGILTVEEEQEPDPEPQKQENTITVKDITKSYSTKKQTVKLNVKVEDKAELTYESDNKKVTVDKNGKVSVAAKFVGKATITITTAETENYNKTVKTVTVTVNPSKTNLSSAKWDKKKKTVMSACPFCGQFPPAIIVT